jgi:L-threonylcarbamoyladenylate synthase
MQEDIQKCLGVLDGGGIILYPTDTIWGIGCDATNPVATEKIYRLKQREDAKAMLVLVDSADMLSGYVEEIPEMAGVILEINEKPLTIIYPAGRHLAENLLSPDGSIGIRITSDPFCNALIRKFRKPIVSTSANLAGKLAPATFQEISEEIRSKVDYTVSWRQDDRSRKKPSGILKVKSNGEIEVIRK